MAGTKGDQGGAGAAAAALGRGAWRALSDHLGGEERTRVIGLLAAVLALSSADASTVGASAAALRSDLGITNTDVGLLVTVSSLVAAAASLPFGVLADRVIRTKVLASAIVLWGVAMVWSAFVPTFGQLMLARLFLGAVTAAAGPFVASLVGDYFHARERGRIYGFILAGELIGAGFGFAVSGNISALSWRAAFVILALPAFGLAWLMFNLREPARGGQDALTAEGEDEPDAEEPGGETDAQRLAREHGVDHDPDLVPEGDPRRLSIVGAARYVLAVRTNVILIIASAAGYYFLAGVQTFGIEFASDQYGIDQAVASTLLLVVGLGAVAGVLAGGLAGDWLLRRGYLKARILVSAVAATAAVILFAPPVFMRSAVGALPWLTFAALALSAQNPPLDAARLDIMIPLLWGRAEGIRTFLRTMAMALAPLLFGLVSDHVFGGGRAGLQWTFAVMLLPLAASAALLYRALGTYPGDVASAAAWRTSEEGKAALAD